MRYLILKVQHITIALPSLIHRIGRDSVNQAKVICAQYQCELKRVRRSRNWTLVGDAINVQTIGLSLKTNDSITFAYLIKKIDIGLIGHEDKLETLTQKLQRLITQTPNITLAELMQLTDCTEVEARTARFETDIW